MRTIVAAIGRHVLGDDESEVVRNRLVFGAGGIIGLKVGFSVLSFGLGVMLARTLGPEGFGAYAYALAWIALLTIPAVLGMDQLLIRNTATYLSNSGWAPMRGLLRTANRAVLVASSLLALLGAGVSLALSARIGSAALATFWVALLLVPLIALTRVRQSVLQGLHHVVVAAFPEQIIQPAVAIILVIAFYFWLGKRLTAPIVMSLNVFAAAIAFMVGARWLSRMIPEPAKRAEPVYQGIEWARSALPLLLLAGMNVLFGQADTLVLGAIKGTHAVGVYSIAKRVADLIGFLLVAQNMTVASTAAAFYSAGEVERLQRLVTRISRWTLLGSLPLFLLFLLFGRWFLSHVYGPAFAEASRALVTLSIGQLINVGMGLNSVLLLMTGHERASTGVVGFSIVADLILNLLLVPHWGIQGAAIASASSFVLLNILASIVLYRRTGINSTAFRGMFGANSMSKANLLRVGHRAVGEE